MKPQKRAPARDITARPRDLRRETPGESSEEGLSIDPEQMGESFLRYATQQGASQDELPELSVGGGAGSDAAQPGSHFSPDASVWENTAGLISEQGGDVDDLTSEASPPPRERESGEPEPPHLVEIDLTESVIDEASLLDEESSVLGETVPKESRTEDTGPRRTQDDAD